MRQSRSFSLIEAVIAVAIVSGMFVAGLSAVGASRASQFRLSQRKCGQLLAQALMAEILQQDYAETGSAVFGPEGGEAAGSRAAFDDVDDYNEWSASPPQQKDGTEMADLTGWRRTVAVAYVSPEDFQQTVASDQGLKRITVTVLYDQAGTASLVAIRSRGRDVLGE